MATPQMPSGRYLTCVIGCSPDYGGQTRAMLMRNRILAREAGIRPTVLTFEAATDYDERRRILLDRKMLLPEITLLNIHEYYREHDWPAAEPTGEKLEDLSAHRVAEHTMPDGSPWRTTYLPPGSKTEVYDYLRADGTPYLRIPDFVYKDASTWPTQIEQVTRSGEVAGTFRSLGQWFRRWIRELTGDERAFVFIDSRYAVPHIVPMPAPNIHLVYLMHNIHVAGPRRWDSEVNDTYSRVLDRIAGMDAMVTLTERQGEDIAQRRGRSENLFVVPNPVDMPEAPANVQPRDPHRVALVARLEPQKRPAQAIQAFSHVVAKVPDAHLDVYGSGSRFLALQRQVRSLGLESSVTLHGHDPHAREALWHASAFLMTSGYEGYPLSTLESMSHGCPVVSYDIKYGPREQITDGVDGFLVPDGDIETMAERVVCLLESPETVERMSAAALEKARHHGTDRFLSDWAGVLNKVVEQRSHRTRLVAAELETVRLEVPRGRLRQRFVRAVGAPALGRYSPEDALALDCVLGVEAKGPAARLDSARLELAAVFRESGAVVELPVEWERKGSSFHLRSQIPLSRLVAPSSEESAGSQHASLRLRLVWRNSVWQGWVQRPPTPLTELEVAYDAQGRLLVTTPGTTS